MHCLKKEWGKWGRIHVDSVDSAQIPASVCGKTRQIVRDCPQNRSQAGVHAHPRLNPQNATAAEPTKTKKNLCFEV